MKTRILFYMIFLAAAACLPELSAQETKPWFQDGP
jgi:hypothetical protein